MSGPYDAVLIVSFGGPEGPDDVLPFLENVLRGRNVPRVRLLEVAEHYHRFGGVSPINSQTRRLMSDLEQSLRENGPALPIYWGNRNWHPLLADTLKEMGRDGVRRSLAFFPSPYSSYSGCRQYLENIEEARRAAGPDAPQVDKLRGYFNHPAFIEASCDRVRTAADQLCDADRRQAPLLFTAHSIPSSMAQNCDYAAQLTEVCRLVSQRLDWRKWQLVYQSRSGPPHQPWLGPDICDAIEDLAAQGDLAAVLVAPIGFISDHMEVIYDLDVEAAQVCLQHGVRMVRAESVGAHHRFVSMIRELIIERIEHRERPCAGGMSARPDVCPPGCCL